ncbi:MAG TPA: hypothetical protein VHM70_26075 [Polyangiaceae bacterium]|nr:hypothetical protein [Polyangiaceae bacterium]
MKRKTFGGAAFFAELGGRAWLEAMALCIALVSSWACQGSSGNGPSAMSSVGTTEGCSPAGAYRCSPDTPGELQICDPVLSLDWTHVAQCASAELCNAGSGACLECTPGDYRCDAWKLEQCNHDGSEWSEQLSCQNEQYCDRIGGQCAVCLSGEAYCGGEDQSTLYVCNSNRTGFNATECDMAGNCNTTSLACRPCITGEIQCNKNDLQRCSDTQQWDVVDTCSSDALCQTTRDLIAADQTRALECEDPVCTMGEFKCSEQDGRTLLGCPPSQDGWITVGNCATGALCQAGIASGKCQDAACSPNTPICQGAELQVCNADGTGYDTIKTCNSAAECNVTQMGCINCTPGDKQCNGALVQECDDQMQWQTIDTCATAALCHATTDSPPDAMCEASICPGTPYRCNGANLEACDANQTSWTAVATCDSPELCNAVDARCEPAGCPVAEQSRCIGNVLQVCPETLLDWTVKEECPSGALCDLETQGCTNACPDPPYRCNNTQPEQCTTTTSGPSWQVVGAPCATAGLCQVNADGASCGTPACGGALPDYRCQGQVLQHCNSARTGWETQTTCAAGAMCDPGPANEGPGQCDSCVPKSYSCMGAALQQCSADGQMRTTVEDCRDAAHCVAGKDSASSYCLVCDSGETQCNADNLDGCANDRKSWTKVESCEFGCSDAMGLADFCFTCAPDEKRCDDTTLLTCNETQTGFDPGDDCDFGCYDDDLDDYCGDCNPDDTECTGNTDSKYHVCGDDGHWSGDMMCPSAKPFCLEMANACVECDPTTPPECTGATGSAGRRTCSAAGAWQTADCTGGTTVCVAGVCVGCDDNTDCSTDFPTCTSGMCTCTMNSQRCTSGMHETCAGTSWTSTPCTGDTPMCITSTGQCGCQQDAHRCQTGVMQTCNLGVWANDTGNPACTSCTTNAQCSGTTPICGTNKVCRACAAAECGASAVCDTDGSCVECTATDVTKCPMGKQVCLNRSCVQCTASASSACTGVTPVCDATSNACRACQGTSECATGTCDMATGACL